MKIKYYTICEKCGKKVYIDASVVYTSLPPKYRYDCPKCGNVSYVFCHDSKIEVDGGRDMEIKEFEFDPKSYLFDVDVKSKCGIHEFIVVDNKVYQSQDRVYCTCDFGDMLIEFEAPNRESSVTKSTIKRR